MVEYRGEIIWDISQDKSEVLIGIDMKEERANFRISTALIPVLIGDLTRVAAAANRERDQIDTHGRIIAASRLVPDKFGGARNTNGDIDLTFHIKDAPLTFALAEEDAQGFAEGLLELIQIPWKGEAP